MEASPDQSAVTEGSAKIFFESTQNPNVFYNPVQQFNRDLSVLAISTFIALFPPTKKHSKVNLLEALSASGLRSIRYIKEIAHLEEITINDLCENAVAAIRKNCAANGIATDGASDAKPRVHVSHADATLVMYQARNPLANFFVIDLDPYGSAAPFIDAAVQAVADGGLLCVTCTDMAVLCGSYTETCFAKYGAAAVRGSPAPHEMALRILLQAIDSAAAKYKKSTEPLLSLSIDFYVRVFVRVKVSAHAVKFAASKRSLAFVCAGCKACHFQPLGKAECCGDAANAPWKFGNASGPCGAQQCATCSSVFHVGGPLWNGPLHNPSFVREMLQMVDRDASLQTVLGTRDRIVGMLSTAAEELADAPLYYPLSLLANVLRSPTPPLLNVYSGLLNAGFAVSGSHCEPAVVKSNAPPEVLWDLMVRWALAIKDSGSFNPEKLSPTSPAFHIFHRFCKSQRPFSFELHPAANPPSRSGKLVRYQANPTPFWGPKSRPAAASKRAKIE